VFSRQCSADLGLPDLHSYVTLKDTFAVWNRWRWSHCNLAEIFGQIKLVFFPVILLLAMAYLWAGLRPPDAGPSTRTAHVGELSVAAHSADAI